MNDSYVYRPPVELSLQSAADAPTMTYTDRLTAAGWTFHGEGMWTLDRPGRTNLMAQERFNGAEPADIQFDLYEDQGDTKGPCRWGEAIGRVKVAGLVAMATGPLWRREMAEALPGARARSEERRGETNIETRARELLAKATPGPWQVVEYADGDSLVIHDARGDWRVCFMATPGKSGDFEGIEANAELICLLRNNAEALLSTALTSSRSASTPDGGCIARLEEALRQWKCPSCGGAKIYTQRWQVAEETEPQSCEVPCKVCEQSGLHPIARTALNQDSQEQPR